jgi:hypothetical protein
MDMIAQLKLPNNNIRYLGFSIIGSYRTPGGVFASPEKQLYFTKPSKSLMDFLRS